MVRTRAKALMTCGTAVAVAFALLGASDGVGQGPAADPVAAEGYGRAVLQRDADAVWAAGATGVLAQVRTADGRMAARSGTADLKTGGPVPWNAYYRIGSITKPFTATVALQLVEEGKLELDDTVERLLPGVVHGNGNDGSRITVANLLRQTSGLNDYDEHLPWVRQFTPEKFQEERFHAYRPEELVALAMKNPPQWLPIPVIRRARRAGDTPTPTTCWPR
ncbi:serine hydrolase domain-containing protein [Streptomyces montanus]|uniref:serine hydrolase domain-containing protein n=1 Tax=Streptomyces montanus TaxID=2580423 RepID=UPI0024827819|nr:serine hydrolase domain-containing protein [Streptomyces montanus]